MAKVKIKTKNGQTQISCKLEGAEVVNQAELAVINSPVTYGFIPASISGKKIIFSFPACAPLSAWLSNAVDRAGFYKIVFRVLDVIYAVGNNNLNINNLDIRIDNIYMSNGMNEIYFAYYPIANSQRFQNNAISIFYDLVNYARPAFELDDYKTEFFNFIKTQPFVSVTEIMKFAKSASQGLYETLDKMNLKQSGFSVDGDETVLLDEPPVIITKQNQQGSLTEQLDTTIYLDQAPVTPFVNMPTQDPDATVLLDESEMNIPQQPVYEAPAPVYETPAPVYEESAPAVEEDPDATVLLDESEMNIPQAPVYETPAPVYETQAPVYEEPAPAVEEDPDATVLLDESEMNIPQAPVYEAPAPVYETPAPVYEEPTPVVEEDPDATVILDESEMNIPQQPVYEAPAPVYDTPAPVYEEPAPAVEEDPDATVLLDESEMNIPQAPVYEAPAPVYETQAPVYEEPTPVAEEAIDETVPLDMSDYAPQPVEESFDETVPLYASEYAPQAAEEAVDETVPLDMSDYAPQPVEESFDETVPLYASDYAPQPTEEAFDETVPLYASEYAEPEKAEIKHGTILAGMDNYQPQETKPAPKSEYNSGDTVLLTDLPKKRAFLILPKRNFEVEITGNKFVVGADSTCCDLAIDNNSISRMHLTVKNEGDDFYAVDNGSTNGTLYNGVPMKKGEPVRLFDLDRLVLANEIVDIKIVEES